MTDALLYDVAIIGGGLAGLSLAIQCAGEGFKVVLFEKENYPFHKVCGEYISFESWNFLQMLGVDLKNLRLPVIKTLHLSDVKGNNFSFELPLGGFGISRFSLDFSLYKIAIARGAEVLTDSKVNSVTYSQDIFTITTTKDQVRARVATCCYGKRSNLDIKWKRLFTLQKANSLNNYIGIKYHIKYPHDPNTIALHNFYNGYCGISKIEDDKSCLCYLTTAQNLKEAGNSIAEMQRKVLYKNPWLREIFSSADFLYDEPLAISQISFSKKLQVEDHLLMLGDAAGMISPLCGNGMSMALHSSKLAHDSIKLFLKSEIRREGMEKKYEAEWQKTFAKRLLIGRNVQSLFGGNTTTSMFIKAMHSIPPLARLLIKSTHGSSF
jgi:flavin-dependent dehydrogenase